METSLNQLGSTASIVTSQGDIIPAGPRRRRLARVLLVGAVAGLGFVVSPLGSTGLVYSTYLGGTAAEEAGGIAVDAAGNVYVTGTTWSANLFTTDGLDHDLGGNADIFVNKFAPDGTLLYSTYVGGPCEEQAHAIAVDANGYAYIAGQVSACSSLDDPQGALVAKLDPAGALVYLYTFGSRLLDTTVATAIAIDSEGNAYVTGSSKGSFDLPTTPSAFQPNSCGGIPEHGFVAKVNPAGDGLAYCTYLCGSGEDSPTAIAVDAAGNAYIAGATVSKDFPTVNAYQAGHRGGVNAESGFLSKLNPIGTELLFSTYLGSSLETAINAIAFDAEGNIYVTGGTAGGDFPTTPGVVQATAPSPGCYYGGICEDAFVTKFRPDGSLVYSTYLAGEGNDDGAGIAVDAGGTIYVVGTTDSTVFPLRHPFQVDCNGPNDAFLVQLSPDASHILFSSYLGGKRPATSTSQTDGDEQGEGIALGPAGMVWVTGTTTSFDFPVTADAFKSQWAPDSCAVWGEPCPDLFLTKIVPDAPPVVTGCHLDVASTGLSPGGSVMAHWAGIPAPTSLDSIMLFELGHVADIWLFVPTFPTTGEAEGTVLVTLPADLAPGSYELRLMAPLPDSSVLHSIARSEPLTVIGDPGNGPPRLVPVLGAHNTLRFRLIGAAPGVYHVEATGKLAPADWREVSTLTVQPGSPAEFTENIEAAYQARFYRVSP